jgi:RoxA-like, cytochrome c-like
MNTFAVWFHRLVWVGILANLALALPGLFATERLLAWLALEPASPVLWPRFASLLLILLSLFYIPAAVNLYTHRANAWLAVLSRFAGVVFFFVHAGDYILFGVFDLIFGLPQAILLMLALRAQRQPVALTAPKQRRARGIAVVLSIVLPVLGALGYVGWYKLMREVPLTYPSVEKYFKYGSIGTENAGGIPYWVWLVLPRMFPEYLPGPGGYASLGIPWEEGHELPVGFAKKTIGFPRIGLNCALCHTATWRASAADIPRLVVGGPSHQFAAQSYLRFLFACASDPRFTPHNILAEIQQLHTLSALDRMLYRFVIIPLTRKGLLQQKAQYAWWTDRTEWGRGRIDPFNPVKFGILKQPIDATIGNADMMSLWNQQPREGYALHWDGLNSSLTEVFFSSALGDGATTKSIDLAGLQRLQNWFKTMPPPAYPFPIDAPLAAQGKDLYAQHCAACHAFGQARTGKVIPLQEVGTDAHRLQMWTEQAATAYNKFAEGYPWKFHGFQKTAGYVAVPHDGLWLRAPYLHNGSVPSLHDLLEVPERRPHVFYRGYDVYDPQRVGFVSDGPEATQGGSRYDTRLPGNGNGGHVFGTALSPEDKKALIEYLKTL